MKKEKKVSFKAKGKYPQKTTMNLLIRPHGDNYAAKVLLFLILGILVLLFLAKFGIYDILVKKSEAENEVESLKGNLAIASAGMNDYDEVMAELDRMSVDYMSDAEAALVNRMSLLDVIDRCVGSYGVISSVSVSNNTASIACTIPTLSMISQMVSTLTREPLVTEVKVSSASGGDNTNEESTLSVSLTISMAIPEAEEGE